MFAFSVLIRAYIIGCCFKGNKIYDWEGSVEIELELEKVIDLFKKQPIDKQI